MQLISILTTLGLCHSVLAIITLGSTNDPRDPRLVQGRSTSDPLDPRLAQTDPPIDRYIMDYRVFGATGCFEQNMGVGTITSSQLDQCFFWEGVKAVNLTNIVDGCSFHIYVTPQCDGESTDLAMGSPCGGNIFDDSLNWLSYKATCP